MRNEGQDCDYANRRNNATQNEGQDLSFVPHSLLTHLLLSVQCFIFYLPYSQSCPSFLIHYSLIYYFLYIVFSSVCRINNLVLRSSFITHPSITFCVVFYLLFVVVTILSFVPHLRNEGQDCDYGKQKIKNHTESNRWVSNE
jgi:hypothetical protein